MSYPFSAMYDENIQTQLVKQEIVKREGDLYSIAYKVWSTGKWLVGADIVIAISDEDAKKKALAKVRKDYKECEGCLLHEVDVKLVDDAQLARAGYYRR